MYTIELDNLQKNHMITEESVTCPMAGLDGITDNDDTVPFSGDELGRILREKMLDCPFLEVVYRDHDYSGTVARGQNA